jgi:hypothetical protein
VRPRCGEDGKLHQSMTEGRLELDIVDRVSVKPYLGPDCWRCSSEARHGGVIGFLPSFIQVFTFDQRQPVSRIWIYILGQCAFDSSGWLSKIRKSWKQEQWCEGYSAGESVHGLNSW